MLLYGFYASNANGCFCSRRTKTLPRILLDKIHLFIEKHSPRRRSKKFKISLKQGKKGRENWDQRSSRNFTGCLLWSTTSKKNSKIVRKSGITSPLHSKITSRNTNWCAGRARTTLFNSENGDLVTLSLPRSWLRYNVISRYCWIRCDLSASGPDQILNPEGQPLTRCKVRDDLNYSFGLQRRAVKHPCSDPNEPAPQKRICVFIALSAICSDDFPRVHWERGSRSSALVDMYYFLLSFTISSLSPFLRQAPFLFNTRLANSCFGYF